MKLDDSNIIGAKARVLFTLFLFVSVCESCTGVLVYPKLLESRTHSSGLVLHVHPGLTLTLEKSSVLAEKLYFGSSAFKNTDRATLNGKELEKNLYHNNEHMTSLVVKRVRGSVEVRGILSHQHGIAPVVTANNTSSGDIPHRIFDVQERSSSFDAKQPTGKQYELKVFTVETCILTSINYTRYFNSTEEIIIYLAAMLNAVALRFSEMVCPTIKFQLNQVLQVPDEKIFGNSTCGTPKNKLIYKEGTIVCGFDAEDTLNKTIDYVNLCESAACDIVYHITSNLSATCINVSIARNYTNESYPGEGLTAEEYCTILLYPEHEDVQASSNHDGDECEVECCWSDNLSMKNEITSTYSEESTSEGNYDYYYANASMCRYFPILDGMICGENKGFIIQIQFPLKR
ncbi:uncharacterized protein [Dermacentor albipictus]|uniref:uncharacterized protein isoform X4 n=1 Tax=Dermacentor albipictus TaxID=60249 RepID=UPI0038FCE3CB